MSNSSRTAKRSCTNESSMVYWMPRQSSETSDDSCQKVTPDDIEEWLTSSVEDSRASHSAKPEKVLENWTRETCGRQPVMFCESSSQDSHSWRTSQACLFQDTSTPSSETCIRSGLMLGGAVYRLPKLGRGMIETDYGLPLIPTPTTSNGRNKTCRRSGGRTSNNDGVTLLDYVTLYPFPGCRPTKTFFEFGAKANLSWMEWLMGWPIGWTSMEMMTECKTLPISIEPEIPRITDSESDYWSRYKAIGNGQVPQCAAMAWRLLTSTDVEITHQHGGTP